MIPPSMMMPSDASGRLSVRFVDEHSGRNDLLGRVAALEAMAAVVARRLEGARPGSRFPLLRLVGRPTPLTAVECDSLAREVTRLRHLLSALPATADPAPDATDAAPDAAADDPAPIDADPLADAMPRAQGARDPSPRTLADAFAWPLFVLEHIARLGAASRRGARFEVGDAAAFARDRTPLSPHAARV
ncbi:MAG: hypothetical protein U1E39_15050 [Planctomycetota bacterium]